MIQDQKIQMSSMQLCSNNEATASLHSPMEMSDILQRLNSFPQSNSLSTFRPSEHLRKINLNFDITKLQASVTTLLDKVSYLESGDFKALPLTRRPGLSQFSEGDLSGKYYVLKDYSGNQLELDDHVNESEFSQIIPEIEGTYLGDVVKTLKDNFPIGRVRLAEKAPYNSHAWHRDPEPRIHIPIFTNPGALFVINDHITHLPADGSAYFTDTRAFHTALNGGESPRTHLLATLYGGATQ